MAVSGSNVVRVAIFLLDQSFDLVMERSATIAQLRSAWHQQICATPSTAFFLPGERYLPDSWTLARAQQEDGGRRVLDLQAVPRVAFRLRLFGFNDTTTVFEAAPNLTPAALREEMAQALGASSSDFRLFADNEEVDMSAPFSAIREGTQLVLDPEVLVRIITRPAHSGDGVENAAVATIDCHASTTVGELRRWQQIPDTTVLIAERRRRVLRESTNIAHAVVSEMELAAPIQLTAEQKQNENLVPFNTAMGGLVESDDTLVAADPLKVVLHHKKKLHICRVPKMSIHADLSAQFRAWQGNKQCSLIASEIDKQRRVALEMMSYVHLSKSEMRMEVQLDHRTYHCRFLAPSVTFSDVVVNIGRQMEVTPRQLFRKQLFCCGCGRRVTRDEEKFQAIPAACCRVRSLKLSDRRVRDAASQTEVRRSRLGGVEPLNGRQLEAANVCVGPSCEKTAVNASTPRRKAEVAAVSSSYKTATVSVNNLCDGVADVPVRVRLPDGLQTWHFVRPQDTTVDLVAAMQRLLPGATFSDVSWGDRWLTSVANWRHHILTSAWRVDIGTELQLHRRPPSLVFSVWNPDGVDETKTMQLGDEQSVFEVFEKAKSEFEKIYNAETAVINAQELLHEVEGRQRRSISCYDPTEGRYLFIDLESGKQVEKDTSNFGVRRYLFSTSVLPGSPFHIPVLVNDAGLELLHLTADRQLEAADANAMQDMQFVAFIEGVRGGGPSGKAFWRISGGGFVDSVTGDLFPNKMQIPDDEGRRSFILCLFRSGDRPPQCRVPNGRYLRVFRRSGVPMTVQGGRLRASEPAQPFDIERWLTPYKVDKFQKDFTASARRG